MKYLGIVLVVLVVCAALNPHGVGLWARRVMFGFKGFNDISKKHIKELKR